LDTRVATLTPRKLSCDAIMKITSVGIFSSEL
jgi:hypothetical protein